MSQRDIAATVEDILSVDCLYVSLRTERGI